MPLTSDEIAALVAEARPLLEGGTVQDVHQSDEHTVFLTLRAADAQEFCLLLSTRPGFSRFHLVENRPQAPEAPLPFSEAARKRLRGSRMKGLRQVSGDRVVELSFLEAASGKRASLVLEITGGRGQLILLGENRQVLVTLHRFRGSMHEPYRFPEARARNPALKPVTSNPWRYLETSPAEAAVPAPAPLHLALGSHYSRLEKRAMFEGSKEALLSSLRRAMNKRSRALLKVRDDLASARAGEELRESGELLKGAMGRLRRGMSAIELEDYFHPGGKVSIRLDPALGPKENIERYFNRYKKARRAVPILEERLARLESECSRLEKSISAVESASSLEQVAEARSAVEQLLRLPPRKEKGPKETSPRGPRRFFARSGEEILVGRSAAENDRLTLRLARGNDVFLHVSGRPGAHVIVRTAPRKPAPLETLLDAAQLALYYSLPQRSRGHLAAGPLLEVHYTPVKFVRKPRGAKPGQVFLSGQKSLRVRLEPERLERLFSSAGEDVSDTEPGQVN